MKKIYIAIFISAFLMAFIFPSCITIERTIKINEDGSGSEVMKVHYGKDFFDLMKSGISALDSANSQSAIDSLLSGETFSKEMKEKYKKTEGIKLNDISSKLNSDSTLNLTINLDFDNVKRLEQSLKSLEDDNEAIGTGTTKIVYKKDSDKILFDYKYEFGSSKDTTNKSLRNSMAAFFRDQKMIFNITFPYKIKSSNAQTTNDKTLSWEFDMEKMMMEGFSFDLHAEMKK